MWNKRWWVKETTPHVLKARFNDLLKKARFSVLSYAEHHFKPHGFTALWLLGESHLAIHTFPEAGKSYIELSSCNKEMYDSFVEGVVK